MARELFPKSTRQLEIEGYGLIVLACVAVVIVAAIIGTLIYNENKRYQHCDTVNGKFMTVDRHGIPVYYIQVGLSNHKVNSVIYNGSTVGQTEVCLTLNGYNRVVDAEFNQ